MGYRLMVAVCALFLMTSCAALDSDSGDPFEGFSPSEIPAPPGAGETGLSGYYTGALTLDSNDCESISDEVGTVSALALDVTQNDTVMSVTFDDGSVSSGNLEGDKATFLSEVMGVRHIYYVVFTEADEVLSADGSCEVFEASEDGVFKEPCASYTISLEEGEKPEADDIVEEDVEDDVQEGIPLAGSIK